MTPTRKKFKTQHAKFLQWLFDEYGTVIKRTQFSEIAFACKTNVQSVRNYLDRLELTGCITIDVISYSRRTITINLQEATSCCFQLENSRCM